MNKKKIIYVTLLIISIITIVIIYPVRFFYLDQIGDIFTKTILTENVIANIFLKKIVKNSK